MGPDSPPQPCFQAGYATGDRKVVGMGGKKTTFLWAENEGLGP